MQQRQLRLGDILDDYCPRERRVTNHAVVAMVGDEVKQTRCTTCDADHQYKHAKIPRPRRRTQTPPALHAPPAAVPKRVIQELAAPAVAAVPDPVPPAPLHADQASPSPADTRDAADEPPDVEGPVHRRLIRAALPRHEGQQAQTRSTPDFTIRQPTGGRPNRFRPRPGQSRGHQVFVGNRSGPPGGRSGGQAGGSMRGGGMGHGGGHVGNRPPAGQPGKRHHSGRKGPK